MAAPEEGQHPVDVTGEIRKLAPAAAEWPSWWRRNLTPGALYTIGAVVLGAVITVTTVIVSHHTDREKLTDLKAVADRIELAQGDLSGDVKSLTREVAEVKKWQDDRDEEARRFYQLRNPYVKSHPKLEQRKAPQ